MIDQSGALLSRLAGRVFVFVRLRRLTAVIAVALLAGGIAAGCGQADPKPANGLAVPTGASLAGDFAGSGPGTLISAFALQGLDQPLRDAASLAARITYTSTSGINNNYVPVTGAVFVPRGNPPQAGWPAVGLGHPTTGIKPECAPSLSRNLSGLSETIVGLLKAGLVVAVTDYQGLGTEGPYHPYLDSTTAGFNLIDSVRAARKLVRKMSGSWVAVGGDQGGQAAWAADELVSDFGGGLRLLGVIDPGAVLRCRRVGRRGRRRWTDQRAETGVAGILAITGKRVRRLQPGRLQPGRRAGKIWDDLFGLHGLKEARRGCRPDRPRRSACQQTPRLSRRFAATCKKPFAAGLTSAPMWVIYGADDSYTPATWTERALQRACGYGDVIQIERQAGPRPDAIVLARAIPWITTQFTYETPVNDCPSFTGETTPTTENETATPTTSNADTDHSGRRMTARTLAVEVSLVHGWVPLLIQGLAVVVMVLALGWRTRRWWTVWSPVALVVGVLTAVLVRWYVDDQGMIGDRPPLRMWLWVGLAGLAVVVLALGWRGSRWWQRVVSALAIPLSVLCALVVLNQWLAYLPTVGAAWDRLTGATSGQTDAAGVRRMQQEGASPTVGTMVTVNIPDDASGFKHREELVYLPPAWYASNPPPRLPVVLMINAEFGHPDDWLVGSDAQKTLDDFVAKHGGNSPVFVFVDSSGTFTNDTSAWTARGAMRRVTLPKTLCHLLSQTSVPARRGRTGNRRVDGRSGACTVTLSAKYPELFSAFLDIDGQNGPYAGTKEQTIARLFDGDAEAWAQFDPTTVMGEHGRYADMAGWFAVSRDTPTVYRSGSAQTASLPAEPSEEANVLDPVAVANYLCELASNYGIECLVVAHGGGRDRRPLERFSRPLCRGWPVVWVPQASR